MCINVQDKNPAVVVLVALPSQWSLGPQSLEWLLLELCPNWVLVYNWHWVG
jgi:hypothetical protein